VDITVIFPSSVPVVGTSTWTEFGLV